MRKLVKKIAVSILINFDTGIEEWQIKRFDEWMGVKEKIHYAENLPTIRDRQVWWCALGENVGVEVNGKSGAFSRPILIFKKINRYSFLGVPLTSVPHYDKWHAQFTFQEKDSFAKLTQIRVLSTSRLYYYMGMVTKNDYDIVRRGLKRVYHL